MLKGSEKYGRYVYTLIRLIFEFILFLAEGGIADVKAAGKKKEEKAARIRVDQKGGYAHKSKRESEK